MVWFIEDCVQTNLEKGYSSIRITGEMSWILENRPGTEKLLQYKKNVCCKLNLLVAVKNSIVLPFIFIWRVSFSQ